MTEPQPIKMMTSKDKDGPQQVLPQPNPPEINTTALSFKPSSFDGLQPQTANRWWQSFNRYAELADIRGKARCSLLGLLLGGSAEMWFNTLPVETRGNFEALEAVFCEKYVAPAHIQLQRQSEPCPSKMARTSTDPDSTSTTSIASTRDTICSKPASVTSSSAGNTLAAIQPSPTSCVSTISSPCVIRTPKPPHCHSARKYTSVRYGFPHFEVPGLLTLTSNSVQIDLDVVDLHFPHFHFILFTNHLAKFPYPTNVQSSPGSIIVFTTNPDALRYHLQHFFLFSMVHFCSHHNR